MAHRNNVVRLDGQPLDYEPPFRFVPSKNAPLTAGERLVAFFRRRQFRIGIGYCAVAIAAGIYFALQLGRGL